MGRQMKDLAAAVSSLGASGLEYQACSVRPLKVYLVSHVLKLQL